jgi:Tol biopolymer transport system component
LLLAVLLALITASGLLWFLRHRAPPPQPPAELIQKRLTFNSSENFVQSNAISPDGKYVAYSDPAGIHVKLLSTGEERLIPKPAGVSANTGLVVASWFPHSTQLLVNTWQSGGNYSMWTVSMVGLSPREPREGAGAWAVSPDATRIAFAPSAASTATFAGTYPSEVPSRIAFVPSVASTAGLPREVWVIGIQGDKPKEVLALGENEWIGPLHWSPDGQRLAYIRTQRTPERYRTSIETCDLNGANRTVVAGSDLGLADFSWLPDGRIVYSRQDSAGLNDANLWQIGIDGHAGTPIGEPKRITQSAGSTFWGFSASADGKRLALVKTTFQGQVYLGELTAGGTRMTTPRRLTNKEVDDEPTAWTPPDSKAVLVQSDRNGTWGIFKQVITQDTAEPVVTGRRKTCRFPASAPMAPGYSTWRFPRHGAPPLRCG